MTALPPEAVGTQDATAPSEVATTGSAASGGDRARGAVPSRQDRRRAARSERRRRWVTESVVLVVLAVVLALLIKAFAFQAFYIPSGSMEPTLEVQDRVIVNKLSYRFGSIHHGDIVVFKAPPAAASADISDLVKRVIGLPGDVIELREGAVYRNNKRLTEPYVPHGEPSLPLETNVPPGCGAPASGRPGCVVPTGRLFMMGDNRTMSKDSRSFGPIKESSVVGRVFLRIWPIGRIGFF